MRLEEQIQTCFDKYPELFQTRWQVLSNMFYSYGTGYEWVNGELINIYEDSDTFNGVLGTDGKAVQRNILPDQIPVGMKFPTDSKNFSPIYNIPENIKPDWLAGIEEVKELAKHQDDFEYAGYPRELYEMKKRHDEFMKTEISEETRKLISDIWNSVESKYN